MDHSAGLRHPSTAAAAGAVFVKLLEAITARAQPRGLQTLRQSGAILGIGINYSTGTMGELANMAKGP
jgi:hypothetical protein